jgi:XTP/dITP diphosphohydrolase
MIRTFVATKNAGKMRELRDIFAGSPLELETYGAYRDVVEGETSYAENAALKANALRAQLVACGISAAVLGDDSGLEVSALGGRPGVLSARYGGANATWAERRGALLEELERSRTRDRSARFVCALHFISAAGEERSVSAYFRGAVARAERGASGFSYDPIFEIPSRGLTFAELASEEKNSISHRARAAAELLRLLAAAKAGGEPERGDRAGNDPPAGM